MLHIQVGTVIMQANYHRTLITQVERQDYHIEIGVTYLVNISRPSSALHWVCLQRRESETVATLACP